MADTPGLLDYETTNAVLAWALIGLALVLAIERVVSGEYLAAGLAATVAAVGAVPPIASGRPRETPAWEVLGLAAVPLLAPSVGLLRGQADYFAVAAIALLIAVELDAFTTVEMTPDVAVAFVVIVTMAVAGLWTIARFASDAYLGTAFLPNQTALMWDLVAATAVGLVAGLVFELYFRRLGPGREIAGEPTGEEPS